MKSKLDNMDIIIIFVLGIIFLWGFYVWINHLDKWNNDEIVKNTNTKQRKRGIVLMLVSILLLIVYFVFKSYKKKSGNMEGSSSPCNWCNKIIQITKGKNLMNFDRKLLYNGYSKCSDCYLENVSKDVRLNTYLNISDTFYNAFKSKALKDLSYINVPRESPK